tara:strand:+ start:78 stop:422 length:345 start_codon:yes stop_codon:yes gene_type:complete
MNNIFQRFLNDLVKISKEGSYYSFFFKNNIYFMLNLFVISNENKLSFEKICKKLVPKFTSRSTIKSILNEGVEKKFIEKYSLKTNKKNKYYRMSFLAKKNLHNWVERQKEIFSK